MCLRAGPRGSIRWRHYGLRGERSYSSAILLKFGSAPEFLGHKLHINLLYSSQTLCSGRVSQAARQWSAKPLFIGSTPIPASNLLTPATLQQKSSDSQSRTRATTQHCEPGVSYSTLVDLTDQEAIKR